MKSLFIVSLPRSLSTILYHAVKDALGLEPPGWVSDGELLNSDRHVSSTQEHDRLGVKYLTESRDPSRFAGAIEYLTTVADVEGHVYKDVVNPFVMARWPRLESLCVLRITRDLADVGVAMMSRGWDYPKNAARGHARSRRDGRMPQTRRWDREALAPWLTHGWWVRRSLAGYPLDQVLEGLIRAENALSHVPGVVVDFDACIESADTLAAALHRLYPEAEIGPLAYMDAAFLRHRDEVLERRETPAHREIRRRVDRIRRELGTD